MWSSDLLKHGSAVQSTVVLSSGALGVKSTLRCGQQHCPEVRSSAANGVSNVVTKSLVRELANAKWLSQMFEFRNQRKSLKDVRSIVVERCIALGAHLSV